MRTVLCLAFCLGSAALSAAVTSGGATAVHAAANDTPVQMEKVDVHGDPFRTYGIHGQIAGSLTSLLGAHNVRTKILGVNPDSPCARSGLKPGDEFVAVNGKKIDEYSVYGLFRVLKGAFKSGQSIPCIVRAGAKGHERTVVLQAMVEPKHRWLPKPEPTAAATAPVGLPRPPKDVLTAATLHDAGRATPEAALQTLLWARSHRDVATLAALIAPFGKGQQPLTATFAGLPESGRHYYGSAELMAACFVAQEIVPCWVQLRKTSTDGDAAQVEVNAQLWDESDHRMLRETFSFVRSADGWRWALSTKTVKAYGDYYRGVPYELASGDAVPVIAWFFQSS